jgi:organic radical activating enzyme
MDIKIQSTARAGDLLPTHGRFLAECAGVPTYVKIVVGSETTDAEVIAAAKMAAGLDPETTIVLQPVTPTGGVAAPAAECVLHWQEECKLLLPNVRVIPQCHKFMNQL